MIEQEMQTFPMALSQEELSYTRRIARKLDKHHITHVDVVADGPSRGTEKIAVNLIAPKNNSDAFWSVFYKVQKASRIEDPRLRARTAVQTINEGIRGVIMERSVEYPLQTETV